VLLSGGIDSFACAHFLRQNQFAASAVFIDFGQAARRQELAATARICELLGMDRTVIRLSAEPTRHFDGGEIPGRNLALISVASLFSRDAKIIAIGIHAGTQYFDCSALFAEKADRLVGECSDGKLTLFAPFISWTKQDIISYSRSEGLDLNLTYSCESGAMPPCGLCLSCRDRSAMLC
jgi:7-cyano-7-deazaguanine synthase